MAQHHIQPSADWLSTTFSPALIGSAPHSAQRSALSLLFYDVIEVGCGDRKLRGNLVHLPRVLEEKTVRSSKVSARRKLYVCVLYSLYLTCERKPVLPTG